MRAILLTAPRARARRGVNLIRLDAFGYTTKKRGTNCFFVEPEVWELLDRVKATLADRDTELLCEVHEHYTMQKRLAEGGFWVYDFALPMLTLQARPPPPSPLCGHCHVACAAPGFLLRRGGMCLPLKALWWECGQRAWG